MCQRLRRHASFLRLLRKVPSKEIVCIIQCINNDTLRTLQDCHLNVLKGTVKLTPKEKKKLLPHKKTIKEIVSKKTSLKKKREIIVQKGGQFLGMLLAPILRQLTQLLL